MFFNMESPQFQYWQTNDYRKWGGLFNWTMTYRQDSDVRVGYGGVARGRGGQSKVKYWRKKKLVVWMVSWYYTCSYKTVITTHR